MQDSFLKFLCYYLLISVCSFPIGRMIPKEYFAYHVFPYKPFSFEKNGKLYERLGIKKWQNHLPDMSRIFPQWMPPKNMSGNYRDRLPTMIQETCVAEFTHGMLSIFGLFGLSMWDSSWRFLLAGIYIFVFNLPYVIIQRYNRPRLVKVYNKLKMKNQDFAYGNSEDELSLTQ